MKSRLILAALVAFACQVAHADYDAKLEAQEKAKRDAAAAEQAKRNAAAQAQKSAAEQKAMRGYLGKDAEGKSDAEVKKLYDARMAKQAADMKAASGKSQGQHIKESMSKGGADMDAKMMGGKSMNDIANMSDAERNAYMKQLEKQYGGAK